MSAPDLPPKPPARDAGRVSLWRYARLFRADILSAQPARLYRARMAEFRTPLFRSFLVNEPALVAEVLKRRPRDFPKSDRVGAGLQPLLGRSVFLTNGADWARQRRLIDPAFEGGRLRDTRPAMQAAARACAARLEARARAGGTGGAEVEIEREASHAAADVIFRTLFSIPIENALAARVYDRFRAYQGAQPILNPAAFLPLPRRARALQRWLIPRRARRAAAEIRALIRELTLARMDEIAAGTAPDDLATKIITARDPETGRGFGPEEMVDQVAIFFLAGHETSASALGWALYLLATHPAWQERVAAEARAGDSGPGSGTGHGGDGTGEETGARDGRGGVAADVFREALRLYPPVPMMVREAACPERFRDRAVPRGSQIVLSPWHLHRHERLWDAPDAFDPGRWATPNGRACRRAAFIPFSAGPRACPGAGFAMLEGGVMLTEILARLHLAPVPGRVPEPVAHLTVRSRNGIWLRLAPRMPSS